MGVGWADLSLALGVVGPPTKRSHSIHICMRGLVWWVMPGRLCQGLHFSPEISVLSVTGRVVHVSNLEGLLNLWRNSFRSRFLLDTENSLSLLLSK